MTTSLTRYISIFNIICFLFSMEMIQANDTVPSGKGLFIAYDIAKPVSYILNNNISQHEIALGFFSNKNYNIAGDFGYGKAFFENNNYNLDVSGVYVKMGFDKKLIFEEKDLFAYGFRIAGSKLNNKYSEVYINDPIFNQLPIQLENSDLFSLWGEFLLKLDIAIVGNLSFGWTIRLKFPLYFQKDAYFKPYFVPGYGKNLGSAMIGLNYYIFYKIPLVNQR